MRYARAGRSANRHGLAGQVGFGDRGEGTVFLVAYMDKLDLAIASESIDHRIQRIADNSVAAFDAGLRQHLPQDVSNSSFHRL
jgi:hypothetical protein